MKGRTNTASTKDWRAASQGMRITAYVETRPTTLPVDDASITKGDIEVAIKKASRRKPAPRRAGGKPGTSS